MMSELTLTAHGMYRADLGDHRRLYVKNLQNFKGVGIEELLKVIDGKNCFLVAVCEMCGDEYRYEDGYYETNEYSYCAECCHW